MGRKGQVTRQRLIDATAALLQEAGLRDLSVAKIARAAETSPATFYLYFKDVEAVVLAAAQSASPLTPKAIKLLEAPWSREDAYPQALAFLREYTNFWIEHGAVLLVRNLEADRGNKPFYDERMRTSLPILNALESKIKFGIEQGWIDPETDPLATSAVFLAAVERLAAVWSRPQLIGSRISKQRLLEAEARLLATMLVGRLRD